MNYIPYILVLLAAMLWGTVGTTQTLLTGAISPFAIACVRSAIGGFTLLFVVLVMKKINFKVWSWKWTFLAAATIALFQCLFFITIPYTGVAVGTVIIIGSSPVFAGIVEWIFWKEKPTKQWVIATLCAITGCILLFSNSIQMEVQPIGILLALCAGFMFALYTNISKQLMKKEATLPAVAMIFSICALLLLPFSLQSGFQWLAEGGNIWPIVFMGVFATSIAYFLFLGGLQKISSSAAVTLSLAEPLTAALLGVFLIGESLPMLSWIGVAMLLGGIIVLTFSKSTAN